MKRSLPALFAIALTSVLCLSALSLPQVIAGSTAAAGSPVTAQDDLEGRVSALEAELKDLRLSNKKQEALLNQAIRYMENQAKSGAKLAQAMQRTGSMGFTNGINFESREVMLAGIKAHCAALQKDVPRLPKAAPKQVTRRR